jgi:release factor glutamine methyltransferase
MSDAGTLSSAFVAAAGALRQAGMETPELDARLLLCHAARVTHEGFIARGREKLDPEAGARLERALARRLKREPMSRITGTREFYGREFLLGPETLDPRADTETLIEAALAHVSARGGRNRSLTILDLGTGTGCILITLLAELPNARGLGTDISQSALALAAHNAARLGVADRACFLAADWLDAIEGGFDLIVANPPYLAADELKRLAPEVAVYDPLEALCGGPDGLEAYRCIAGRVQRVLTPHGKLLVEIGPNQAKEVAEIFRTAGLEVGAVEGDLAGRPRVVVAVC